MTTKQPDLPKPPPASTRRGRRGHDTATKKLTGIELIRLRASGATYAQVAEAAGYATASGARQAVVAALTAHEAEAVDELRTLENARLDRDEFALVKIITDQRAKPTDRVAAVNARTRLADRRAKLNGLDAPQRLEHAGTGLVVEILPELLPRMTDPEDVETT